jgi:geranylgeranyl pyrophosphate synthase
MESNQETPLPLRATVAFPHVAQASTAETAHESGTQLHPLNGSDPFHAQRTVPARNGDSEQVHRLVHRRCDSEPGKFRQLPDDPAVCKQIHSAAATIAATLDEQRPIDKRELEQLARALLSRIDLPLEYLGYAMVMIGNAFWREQFLSTPFARRLLLLPGELPHDADCAADQTRLGSVVSSCGACALSGYHTQAERLGYQVLIADRSSAVLSAIVEGSVDGILGVARMNVLEKAIDKALIAGVPSYVVPLPESLSAPWGHALQGAFADAEIADMLEHYKPRWEPQTMSYVPLMRSSIRLFTDDFARLLPRTRSTTPETAASPLGITEVLAYDWLANGGKRFRPFITLAAYDALTGGQRGTPSSSSDDEAPPPFPDAVCRVAMAIEAFHKASLVHDDIQDDDQFRYGRQTLHRSHGVGPAINIGDYLIGLGYRLVNSCADDLGADVACDVIHSMAEAHIKLCDGQGAEMAWQLEPDWSMTPADTLHIYALKTAPAFEAALYAGLRMAGPVESMSEMLPAFARHLGVGFQVLNDLKDWHSDPHNKILAGQDALAVRPTLLLALALEAASDRERRQLQDIYQFPGDDQSRLARLRWLFHDLGAFDRAQALVDQSRQHALTLRAGVQPPRLRQLFRFLVDTVLAQETSVAQ